MIMKSPLKTIHFSFILAVFCSCWSLTPLAADASCLDSAQKEKKELACLELEKSNLKNTAIHEGSGGTLKAYASFVTLKRNSSSDVHFLFGEQTQLESPNAAYWDEAEQEVFILNQSGDILVFTDFLFGDVAPKRLIKNKEIPGATDLVALENHVIILNAQTSRVLFFNKDANSRALSSKRKDQVSTVFDLPVGKKFIALTAKNENEVFVLDDKGGAYKITKDTLTQVGLVEGALNINYKTEESGAVLIFKTAEGSQSIALP